MDRVRDLGPLRFGEIVHQRTGGYSASIRGRSVWTFRGGQSPVEPGAQDLAVGVVSDFDPATRRVPRFGVNGNRPAIPIALVPLLPGELTVNAERAEKKCEDGCWGIEPQAIVAVPERERALVFYRKRLLDGGFFPNELAPPGTSLAVWTPSGAQAVRPIVRPGSADPTLLFDPDEPDWGSGALVEGDSLYTFACRCEGPDCPCLLARVPLDRARDLTAWRFSQELVRRAHESRRGPARTVVHRRVASRATGRCASSATWSSSPSW